MAGSLLVDGTPRLIAADPEDEKILANGGAGILYYKTDSSVSATSNDGSLTAGQSLRMRRDFWVAASSRGAQVVIDEFTKLRTEVDNLGTFNALHRGADPTRSIDSVVAIQQAIDDAVAAGGGTVYIPDGDYRLVATSSADGIIYHLIVYGDNVRIKLGEHARLYSEAGSLTAAFVLMGWAKGDTQGAALGRSGVVGDQWRTNYWHAQTPKAISNVDEAVQSLTLTTHSQANIADGHALLILTGAIGRITTPDAELNESAGGDTSTGVLSLRWPTEKHYEQEYVASADVLSGVANGSSQRTPSTAFLAPFGVIDVEATTIRNVGISGGEIHGQNVGRAVNYYGVLNGPICDPFPRCVDLGAFNGQSARGFYFNRPEADAAMTVLTYGVSTTTTSGRIVKPRMRNRLGTITLELSEGSSNIAIDNPVHHNNPAAASDQRSISAGNRNRNLRITDPEIINHAHGNAILCQDDLVAIEIVNTPNLLIRPRVHGSVVGSPGRIIGPTWQVIDDRSPDPSNRMVVAGSDHSDQAPTEVQELAAQITYTDANNWIVLGAVPLNAVITKISFERRQAFDAGTSNRLDIGDGTSVFFLNNGDIAGTNNGPLILPVVAIGLQTVARSVTARYRYSGTAPTAGKLIVRCQYVSHRITPSL